MISARPSWTGLACGECGCCFVEDMGPNRNGVIGVCQCPIPAQLGKPIFRGRRRGRGRRTGTERDFNLELLLELDRSRPRELRAQLEHQLRRDPARPARRRLRTAALARARGRARPVAVGGRRGLRAARCGGLCGGAPRIGDPRRAPLRPSPAPPRPAYPPAAAFGFHSGLPDPRAFPSLVWLRHYRAALQSDIDRGLGYPACPGREPSCAAPSPPTSPACARCERCRTVSSSAADSLRAWP